MKLYLDTTNGRLVTSTTDATPLNTLPIHQGDIGNITLTLLTATGSAAAPFTVIALPADYEVIKLGARLASDLTQDELLFSATEWTASGSGDSRVYTAPLNRETSGIAAAFPAENTTLRSVAALLDIQFSAGDESAKETPLKQWPVVITRDIVRDTEGVPPSGSPLLRAAWMPGITGLTGGGAANLDGVATVGRLDDALLLLKINGTLQIWQLNETDLPTPTSTQEVVVPADFDADANPVIWQLLAMNVLSSRLTVIADNAGTLTLDGLDNLNLETIASGSINLTTAATGTLNLTANSAAVVLDATTSAVSLWGSLVNLTPSTALNVVAPAVNIIASGNFNVTTGNLALDDGAGSVLSVSDGDVIVAGLVSTTIGTTATTTTLHGAIAVAETINGVTIVDTNATLDLAGGALLGIIGAYEMFFTATADTSVTLPLTGTLATLSGVESISNKTFSNCTFPTLNQSTTGSAATLTTGRTLAITGDLAWASPSFNGSGNVTAAGTLATVNSNVGSFGSATQSLTVTVNAKGLITAVSAQTVTPAIGSITGLGTGVATMLGSAVTGSGGSVCQTSPTLTTPTIASFTNATHTHTNAAGGGQLSLTAAVTGILPIANGGTGYSDLTSEDCLFAADDFISGSNVDGDIGLLGWRLAVNSVLTGTPNSGTAYQYGEANHPGIFRIASGMVSGNSQGLFLAGSAVGPLAATTGLKIRVVFRLGSTAACAFFCGITNDFGGLAGQTNSATRYLGLRCDTNDGDTVFYAVAKNAASETKTTTAVALSTGWHNLLIELTAGGSTAQITLNGTVVSLSTNLIYDAAPSYFACESLTRTNATKSADVDMVKIFQALTR